MPNRLQLSSAERAPFADAHAFEATGAYERIAGVFAVDPKSKAPAGIIDVDKAPRDANGLVHFTGDFLVSKPSAWRRAVGASSCIGSWFEQSLV